MPMGHQLSRRTNQRVHTCHSQAPKEQEEWASWVGSSKGEGGLSGAVGSGRNTPPTSFPLISQCGLGRLDLMRKASHCSKDTQETTCAFRVRCWIYQASAWWKLIGGWGIGDFSEGMADVAGQGKRGQHGVPTWGMGRAQRLRGGWVDLGGMSHATAWSDCGRSRERFQMPPGPCLWAVGVAEGWEGGGQAQP